MKVEENFQSEIMVKCTSMLEIAFTSLKFYWGKTCAMHALRMAKPGHLALQRYTQRIIEVYLKMPYDFNVYFS